MTEQIKNYILSLDEFTIPQVQDHFNSSYMQVRSIVSNLIADGEIEFVSDITYKKVGHVSPVENEIKYYDNEFADTLWQFIDSDEISVSAIQRKCGCVFSSATKALNWMEENGYVSKRMSVVYKIIISKENFIKRFGLPKSESDFTNNDDDIVTAKSCNCDNNDDDIVTAKSCNSEALIKSEIVASENDAELIDAIEKINVKEILRDHLASALRCSRKNKKYFINIVGEQRFDIIIDYDNEVFRVTDCGKTLSTLSVPSKVLSMLLRSNFSVDVNDDGEAFIECRNPQQLLGRILTLYAAIEWVKRYVTQ